MPPLTADAPGSPAPGGADGDAAPASPAGSPASLETRLLATGRGDQSAFAALYDDVAPRIHGLVLRIVRDLRQTDTLTQEIFLEIWRTSSRFNPRRGPALSWMMTLAHRKAVASVRSARVGGRHAWRRADDAATSTLGTAAPFSFHTQTLVEALAQLTSSQRLAVELTYFGGQSSREVSEVSQVPYETTHACLCNGMRRLRDLLKPDGALPV